MGSDEGVPDAILMAVAELEAGGITTSVATELGLDDRMSAALAYADAMTTADVDDELFERVKEQFSTDEIVELTEVVAWENASARFNRAMRIESPGIWKRS